MKILVTGGNGLLAWSLRRLAPADCEFTFADLPELDLTKSETLIAWLDRARPDVVINTAAYNLVDRCEVERELSWAVNAQGPETLAGLCAARGCRMVHFSSDYVFDGNKRLPYVETDVPNPLNHYGSGKLAGEKAVLAASPANLVLRTSWLFGNHPTQAKSFIHTVLRLTRQGHPLKAAFDQVAAPTFGPDLAGWVIALLRSEAAGLFHAVNEEGVSRLEWTRGILSALHDAGLIPTLPPVEAVPGAFFNATMPRPDYSVLGNSKLTAALGKPVGTWRRGLREMLAEHAAFPATLGLAPTP